MGDCSHNPLPGKRIETSSQRKGDQMSVLSKLASTQGRKDDNPNKELGREPAENYDIA
jgi:hypothetical protein